MNRCRRISCRRDQKYSWSLHATETGISSNMTDLLAWTRLQLLHFLLESQRKSWYLAGTRTPPAATRRGRHVALANLFFQFLVTFVTVKIGAIAYVLPYILKLLKLVFSEHDAPSYCTPYRAVKFNANGHKCSEACCGFGATPAKMHAVVSVLDKNICSYRRSNVKNLPPQS